MQSVRNDKMINCHNLHQVAGQFTQLAALSLYQVDVGKQILVAHTVYHVDESVRLRVQVGLVGMTLASITKFFLVPIFVRLNS